MINDRLPIDLKATEVAFFHSWRAVPRIFKITKHSATQVTLENSERYSRVSGKEIGGYADRRIENVTAEIRERVAATELHADAEKIWDEAWCALQVQHSAETEALRKLARGRQGDTVAEVQATVARLKKYLEDLK